MTSFDSAKYRQVLGHFPTGVTVITASLAGEPVGLAVGSFASVSLEPPLVGFFPDRSSSSWPKIREAGSFCVNILEESQEDVCRRFAMKGDDKFAGLGWSPAATGSPLIDQVIDAGDHFCVLGAVRDLGIGHDGRPLVFFRGGYGRFDV